MVSLISLGRVTGKTGTVSLSCCQHGMAPLYLTGRASGFKELDATRYQNTWPLRIKISLIVVPKGNVHFFFLTVSTEPHVLYHQLVVFSGPGILLNLCYYTQLIALWWALYIRPKAILLIRHNETHEGNTQWVCTDEYKALREHRRWR